MKKSILSIKKSLRISKVQLQIVVLSILLFFTISVSAQNSCSTAIILPNLNDSLSVPEFQNNNTNWYYFIASEQKLEIDLYSDLSSGNSNFNDMILWGVHVVI